MKKIKLLYLILPILLFSCEDWLDVKPSDQVSEDELFQSGEGYRNALLGIYKDISTTDMYAQQMTWGFMDVLAQYYDMYYADSDGCKAAVYYARYNDGEYSYEATRTKPIIENLWSKPYNAIANCNNLIQNLENADVEMFKDGLGEDELNLIKGEAYALRAFLHFDLLRIFAASPKVNPSGKYIPYCNTFPSIVNEKKEVNTVIDSIISDLEKGERLTIKYDTLCKGAFEDVVCRLEYRTFGLSEFLSFRGYRLNYYAIRALKARAYLYKGDLENARKEARYIMDQELLSFTRSYQIKYGKTKLYDDIIFALYNNHLADYYKEKNYTKGYDDIYLALRAEEMFDVDLYASADKDTEKDYRYSKLVEKRSGEMFLSKKYPENEGKSNDYNKKIIPIIRYSEILLIYAECMYDIDKEKAKKALYYLRYYRGSQDDIDISSKENFMKEIKLEYQREFIGEGQMFYFYKRLNQNIFVEGEEMDMSKNFIIPIPDIESVNN